MITVKHFLDAAEPDDGQRIWVEPIGLTRDLREWCKVDHVMSHLGPPKELWEWFQEHPDGYEYFRGSYHETLHKGPYRAALQQLACAGMKENFTLVHDGDDRDHNTATALHEFLSELEAYCPREEEPGETETRQAKKVQKKPKGIPNDE
ncbi:MAG TPA: DUF488 family protein [Tepidisphaeraceae bacterium]|jgi:uncharacterized protein YeaO (DUF488 family)|nr:DUF488 family protein [Tepidisphaeraceae bacterium]